MMDVVRHETWRPGGSREGADGALRRRMEMRPLLAPLQGARPEGGGVSESPVVAPPANVFRASGSEVA